MESFCFHPAAEPKRKSTHKPKTTFVRYLGKSLDYLELKLNLKKSSINQKLHLSGESFKLIIVRLIIYLEP